MYTSVVKALWHDQIMPLTFHECDWEEVQGDCNATLRHIGNKTTPRMCGTKMCIGEVGAPAETWPSITGEGKGLIRSRSNNEAKGWNIHRRRAVHMVHAVVVRHRKSRVEVYVGRGRGSCGGEFRGLGILRSWAEEEGSSSGLCKRREQQNWVKRIWANRNNGWKEKKRKIPKKPSTPFHFAAGAAPPLPPRFAFPPRPPPPPPLRPPRPPPLGVPSSPVLAC